MSECSIVYLDRVNVCDGGGDDDDDDDVGGDVFAGDVYLTRWSVDSCSRKWKR